MATVQTHQRMMDEILSTINESEDVYTSLRTAMKDVYFKKYMTLAVSDEWPTIDILNIVTKKYGYHRSMAGAYLLSNQTWKIISQIIMTKSAKDSSKFNQFNALSEMLYTDEAKILVAILTKDITSLYSNIEFETIVKALNDEG